MRGWGGGGLAEIVRGKLFRVKTKDGDGQKSTPKCKNPRETADLLGLICSSPAQRQQNLLYNNHLSIRVCLDSFDFATARSQFL